MDPSPITAADMGRTAAKAAHTALRQMGSGKTMLEQELLRSDKGQEVSVRGDPGCKEHREPQG